MTAERLKTKKKFESYLHSLELNWNQQVYALQKLKNESRAQLSGASKMTDGRRH